LGRESKEGSALLKQSGIAEFPNLLFEMLHNRLALNVDSAVQAQTEKHYFFTCLLVVD